MIENKKIEYENTIIVGVINKDQTENIVKDFVNKKNIEEIDDICEECKKEDLSVSQNLILSGFKVCSSCKLSKTIYPI